MSILKNSTSIGVMMTPPPSPISAPITPAKNAAKATTASKASSFIAPPLDASPTTKVANRTRRVLRVRETDARGTTESRTPQMARPVRCRRTNGSAARPRNGLRVSSSTAPRVLVPGVAAVALEEVVDPGARAGERSMGRRDVGLERFGAAGGVSALVHAHPDTGLIHHLTSTEEGAAAGAIAHLLGTRLRTDVLHLAQHAVATGLAAEHRPLHGQLDALRRPREAGMAVDE